MTQPHENDLLPGNKPESSLDLMKKVARVLGGATVRLMEAGALVSAGAALSRAGAADPAPTTPITEEPLALLKPLAALENFAREAQVDPTLYAGVALGYAAVSYSARKSWPRITRAAIKHGHASPLAAVRKTIGGMFNSVRSRGNTASVQVRGATDMPKSDGPQDGGQTPGR